MAGLFVQEKANKLNSIRWSRWETDMDANIWTRYCCTVLSSVVLGVTMSAAQVIAPYEFLDGDAERCPLFLERLNAPPMFRAELIPNIALVEEEKDVETLPMPEWYVTRLSQSLMWLDFNNDGETDLVGRYSGGGSYVRGTILFVVYGAESKTSKVFPDNAEAVYSFPCQFDKSSPKSTQCPLVKPGGSGGGVQISMKEDAYFNGRYTEIDILRRQGKTYLELRSNTDDNKSYAAIIEPHEQNKFHSVCLFKRSNS